MAENAPSMGSRTRAPRVPAAAVPARDAIEQMQADARLVSVAAEQIDAIVLAVEALLEKQRELMRELRASSMSIDNELWDGISVLLTMTREQAIGAGRAGEAIDAVGTRAMSPAAA